MKRDKTNLENTILDIENFSPQVIPVRSEDETFELWLDPALLLDLSGNLGSFIIRAILNKLNINEHYVFRWRLENKYQQYQILNHYVPNCMAETISVSQILHEDKEGWKIRELCNNGFFIKSTLGDGSGRANTFDRTDELDDIIRLHKKEESHQEKWVLQKRLRFVEEFRIHTFSKDLIYGLTFIIKGHYDSDGFDAEVFVKGLLDKLPDTILQGTLIGWDIGITDTHEHYVIEANVTGFHPEINRGFQTSGYFGDRHYRSIICAWINNYFRTRYQISIGSVQSDLFSSDPFYKEFMFYSSMFRAEHLETIKQRTKDSSISAIIYFGEEIKALLVNIISYMQITNCAEKFYLIINKEHFITLQTLFEKSDLVYLIEEEALFTNDEYLVIKSLTYEMRKKNCFQHVKQIINDGPYLMF